MQGGTIETWMLLEYADRGSLEQAIQMRRFYKKADATLDLVRALAGFGGDDLILFALRCDVRAACACMVWDARQHVVKPWNGGPAVSASAQLPCLAAALPCLDHISPEANVR